MLMAIWDKVKVNYDLLLWKWNQAMKNHAKNGEYNVHAAELLTYVLYAYAFIGFLICLVVFLVFLGVLDVKNLMPEQPKLVPQVEGQKKKEKKKHKWFSTDVVAKHNTSKDCWVTVENKVYNMTKFVKKHPEHESIVESAGGALSGDLDGFGDIEEYFIGYLIEVKKDK